KTLHCIGPQPPNALRHKVHIICVSMCVPCSPSIDACRRAKHQRTNPPRLDKVHNKDPELTMKRFIDLAKDPKVCMNTLDLPNVQPEIPIFLRYGCTDIRVIIFTGCISGAAWTM